MLIISIIILVLIVIAYISYYYRRPKDMHILQSTLANFKFDMLREKQPIVIQDRVATLSDLEKLWFTYNSLTRFELAPSDPQNPLWIANSYKFTLIHATSGDCEVLLSHVNNVPDADGLLPEEAAIIAIQLATDQIVIVPLHMHYAICSSDKNNRCHCIGVHDLITRMLPAPRS